jgi:hypothetical protein
MNALGSYRSVQTEFYPFCQNLNGSARRARILSALLLASAGLCAPSAAQITGSGLQQGDPSRVMQAVKRGFARRVFGAARKKRRAAQQELFAKDAEHVWQRRFYDFNVWSERKRIEKLRYMHRNPVKRGLGESPEQWRWSSYRFYLLQEAGPVRVNEGWTEISFRDRAA